MAERDIQYTPVCTVLHGTITFRGRGRVARGYVLAGWAGGGVPAAALFALQQQALGALVGLVVFALIYGVGYVTRHEPHFARIAWRWRTCPAYLDACKRLREEGGA